MCGGMDIGGGEDVYCRVNDELTETVWKRSPFPWEVKRNSNRKEVNEGELQCTGKASM